WPPPGPPLLQTKASRQTSTFVFSRRRDPDDFSGQGNRHVQHFDVARESPPPSPHFRNARAPAAAVSSSRVEPASNQKVRGLRHRYTGSREHARKNHPSVWR